MARLIQSGFEMYSSGHTVTDTGSLLVSPDGDGEAGSSGVLSLSTTVKNHGSSSLKCDSSVGNGSYAHHKWTIGGVLDRGYYIKFMVRSDSLPGNVGMVMGFDNAPSGTGMSCQSGGNILISEDTSGSVFTISQLTWYRFELYVKFSATQANRAWEFRVNGTTKSSG